MSKSLTVRATDRSRSSYRRLLRSDWSVVNFRKVIDLSFSILPDRASSDVAPWRIRTHQNGKFARISAERIERIVSLSSAVSRPVFASSSVDVGPIVTSLTRRTSLESLVFDSAALLLIEADFDLNGSIDFYHDLQSLLFLMAAESLLPLLREGSNKELVDFFSRLLDAHLMLSWSDRPDQKYFLMSVLASVLGDKSTEETALRVSLELSSPNEHEYVSKAQAYWSFLMGEERFHEAMDLLLNVYRAASCNDLDEIRELIKTTQSEAFAKSS